MPLLKDVEELFANSEQRVLAAFPVSAPRWVAALL